MVEPYFGQLYTVEGVAAGILIIVTTTFILGSTTILTPAETHISDLQMEVLGTDLLACMAYNESYGNDGSGPLQMAIVTGSAIPLPGGYNNTTFNSYLNLNLNNENVNGKIMNLSGWNYSKINYCMDISYLGPTGTITTKELAKSVTPFEMNHINTASYWILIPQRGYVFDASTDPTNVRVEMKLWRD